MSGIQGTIEYTGHLGANSKEAGTPNGSPLPFSYEILLRAAAVEQRCKRVGIGFKDLQQDAVPVAGILLAAAEHIVLLAIVDGVEARNGLVGSGGAVGGRVG